MKILHTSDWHLGRSLYGKQRFEEFSAFLEWMVSTLNSENIDILLIAGDIFDTTTPGNRAQELYYKFLFSVASSSCKHVVITSGNHDSPSFLSAPKEILKFLNVHIVANCNDIEDEVIVLNDGNKEPMAIICAVPYLRDRDIRAVLVGESIEDKNLNLVSGIRDHYKDVCEYAVEINKTNVPIIGMGHLFASGGKTMDGDGVRELYVGSLAHIGAEIFPSSLNYVALGHLHVPQKVGGMDHIRYSGSPIPMGFGEAKQKKTVIILDFNGGHFSISDFPIPRFQELLRVMGSRDEIISEIEELKRTDSKAWLEVGFNGVGAPGNLQDELIELVEDSGIEIRIIKNSIIRNLVLQSSETVEDLKELSVYDVFNRCLDLNIVEDSERELLKGLYNHIVNKTLEEDSNL